MNETIMKTLGVTLVVCLLCSLFVSFTAVSLRDQQNTNKLNDKRIKILEAANIYDQSISCLLYTSPSPRDSVVSRMPSSA